MNATRRSERFSRIFRVTVVLPEAVPPAIPTTNGCDMRGYLPRPAPALVGGHLPAGPAGGHPSPARLHPGRADPSLSSMGFISPPSLVALLALGSLSFSSSDLGFQLADL